MCLRCALLDVLVVLVVIGVVLHRDVVRQRDAANGAHAVQDFERALMAIRLLCLQDASALQDAQCLAKCSLPCTNARCWCLLVSIQLWRRPIQL